MVAELGYQIRSTMDWVGSVLVKNLETKKKKKINHSTGQTKLGEAREARVMATKKF